MHAMESEAAYKKNVIWVARLIGVQLLILASVMISGLWDPSPHQAACSEGSQLGILSAPLPLPCLLSLSKIISKKKKVIPICIEREKGL